MSDGHRYLVVAVRHLDGEVEGFLHLGIWSGDDVVAVARFIAVHRLLLSQVELEVLCHTMEKEKAGTEGSR